MGRSDIFRLALSLEADVAALRSEVQHWRSAAEANERTGKALVAQAEAERDIAVRAANRISQSFEARAIAAEKALFEYRGAAFLASGTKLTNEIAPPRRFLTYRTKDVSGISGCGCVAEGVQFHTGQCVLCWKTDKSSVAVYGSIEELEAIHGHDGSTKVVWIDQKNV